MDECDDADGYGQAKSDSLSPGQRTCTVVEGGEALHLYVRQIARNLTELEEQVILLREACAERQKLLREIE